MINEQNTSEVQTARLFQDFVAAIKLRISFFQNSIDKDFLKNKGTIYYAVDTNVINKRFLSTSKKNQSILNLFEGPDSNADRNIENRISDVLIEYVVSSLKSGKGTEENIILLLPGHLDEARKRYRSLLKNISPQIVQPTMKSLERHFNQIDELATDQLRLQYLDKNEDEIHRLIYFFEKTTPKIQRVHKTSFSAYVPVKTRSRRNRIVSRKE